MSDRPAPSSAEGNLTATGPFLYWLAVGLVVTGLMNSIPGIPGFDQGLRDPTGQDWFKLRKFTREWFFPMVPALMMLIVALKHSMYGSWQDRSALWRRFGLFMDVALIIASFGISLTYVVEIEAICLIDQFTGERDRLIARSLADAAETAALYGLPLVIVALLVALYTIGTVLVWYFHGPDDINKYLMTKLPASRSC